jgi:hypothetical protein
MPTIDHHSPANYHIFYPQPVAKSLSPQHTSITTFPTKHMIEGEQTPNSQTSKAKGSTNLLLINKMEHRLVIQTHPQEIPMQIFYSISNADWDRE